jgi:hypothetical protein
MDDQERLERLGRRARLDEPPPVHVRAGVLAAVGQQALSAPDLCGLKWAAVVSLAALVAFVVAAALAWSSWSDPLLSVLYGGL